ncbi:putative beta-lysine N-acetyltransferase [Cellulophaga algicola DSM 14237]|uniref:Beta-lysine N-acetyltransferase n=1 Tax=Cellulophaga algicola (strain DSM 14237 / IC166 / ACAM 630) TaxID=688270 RepID=E6XCM5_CELAD|nr:putative beta-lysine N-acetyltransferase [Cellulophaga algicola]ADV49014.1 putative beta-lysine N-acetyltransferase [Cellulophaga algicola DSM 14237]
MFDTIEKIEGAVLRHGKTHSRLYLTQSTKNNWDSLIPKMKDIAHEKKYDKIISKVPEQAIEIFESNGFHIEAKIPGLYNGITTGYFLAEYLNENRCQNDKQALKTIASVKAIAQAAKSSSEEGYMSLPTNFEVRKLTTTDFSTLATLHKKAFMSHSLPIHEEAYLLELAEQNHEFYGLFKKEELIVSSILHIHKKELNIEIVDFATHPDYNGQNLSYYLLQEIKKKSDKASYKTIYSLVRATSYGLNITFSKHGFHFGGTLYNNTVIRNSLESMNVWYSN